ncbi:MAG TPA: hypothetical protein DCE41_18330 [Cytophagales bacterium]|nr:hypothetical protein [Cytophagales bacterium]HAA19514.1 hypothetical protein [Cytophagales bacterium]HAP59612.1 hypothetical protein [Cytophagales bacterium]
MRWILVIGLLLFISACGKSSQAPADLEFDLCDCNTWDRGQRDMKLSQRCIDACLKEFGPNLEGMEEWFQENCDPMDEKKDTEEHYTFWPDVNHGVSQD